MLRRELVQTHWCHHILHNKRAAVQKGLLLLKGNQRVVVISVPWYLQSELLSGVDSRTQVITDGSGELLVPNA
jgi:hypothetical protein